MLLCFILSSASSLQVMWNSYPRRFSPCPQPKTLHFRRQCFLDVYGAMRKTRDAFPSTFHNPCDCRAEECFQRNHGRGHRFAHSQLFFRAVAPEDGFLLRIERADPDLQAIEDVAVDLGILKGRHGAAAIWVPSRFIGGEALRVK